MNGQFQSVFTSRSPLSLSQLAHMKVQSLVDCRKLNPGSYHPRHFDTGFPDFNSRDLKPRRAAGPDQIRPLILEELRNKISPIIMVIFGRSVETGKLPMDRVFGTCDSGVQKCDKTQAVNYRPTSLTLQGSRAHHGLPDSKTHSMNEPSLLYGLQHGFRKKRSCEIQLTMLVDDLPC